MKGKGNDGLQVLLTHAFTHRVFEDCRLVYGAIGVPGKLLIQEFTQEPDEYEFYVLTVGNRVTHLVDTCRQLEDAILYMFSFKRSVRMKRAGINRHSHLLYNIENFIIRTSSLYDRALKLVDAVFHLGNHPRECRSDTILKNVHVKRTNVSDQMKLLRKLVDKYSQDRNLIIHHEAYQDRELRLIEMYTFLQRELELAEEKPSERLQHLPELTKERIRDVVRTKTQEFEEFNREMFSRTVDLFSELDGVYLRQKARLLTTA